MAFRLSSQPLRFSESQLFTRLAPIFHFDDVPREVLLPELPELPSFVPISTPHLSSDSS